MRGRLLGQRVLHSPPALAVSWLEAKLVLWRGVRTAPAELAVDARCRSRTCIHLVSESDRRRGRACTVHCRRFERHRLEKGLQGVILSTCPQRQPVGVVHVDGVADADGGGGDVPRQLRLPRVVNIKLAAARRSWPIARLLEARLE